MGAVIFFMLLFTASIVVGLVVLAYAARSVLVIVEETAAGQDNIIWPSEPYVDWLGHAVQFLELVGIWLAPSALAARMLRNVWLPDDGALRVLLLAVPGLWLFFPVGLLSSLSAQSRWVPFRWAIVKRFLRVAPAAVLFYFLTGLVCVIGVVPWYYTLFGGGHLLPVAAAVSAAALFIYSRLLGRLAWIIQRLPETERKPATGKIENRSHANKRRAKKKRKSQLEVHDPWSVPDAEMERGKEEPFPWAKEPAKKEKPDGYHIPTIEEIGSYGLAADELVQPERPEKPLRSPIGQPPEEDEPINVQDAPKVEPPPRETQSEVFAEQVRQRLAERTHEQPAPPAHPFFSGVFTFPLYSACLSNVLALFLAFLVQGGLVYQMIQTGQQLFGW